MVMRSRCTQGITPTAISVFYMAEGDPDPEETTSAEAVKFLTDLLEDRVVMWSRTVDGKPTSGGSYYLGAEHTLRSSDADSFLWSGKRA